MPAHATETDIRRAYAQRLKTTRPDDDPVAFQALREAYERARQIAQARAAREARDEPRRDDVEVRAAAEPVRPVGTDEVQAPDVADDPEATRPPVAPIVPEAVQPPVASVAPEAIQPPAALVIPEAIQPPATPVVPEAIQPPAAPVIPEAIQPPAAPVVPAVVPPPTTPAIPADPSPPSPPRFEPPEPPPTPPVSPNEIATAAWQRFIASRRGPPAQPIALAAMLRDDALTHLAARDAFELLCAQYCARDNADPALRIEIADIMQWERDSSFILRALQTVGHLAMARVQADRLSRRIEHDLPKAFALLSNAPVSPQRARLMLLSSRRATQLNKALAALRGHPRHVVVHRFDLATLAFWEAQYDSRLKAPAWQAGVVLAGWFAAIVWVAAGPFRLLMWAPPWVTFAALPIFAATALLVPALALLFWPDRARRWYRRVEDRPPFRYGWIGLWTIASITLMEGRLHDLQGIQLGGLFGLIAALGWAMAAVPASLYSMSLVCSLMLAPVLGTQAFHAEVFGARSLLWSLINGPLILALLPVQTSLSLALRTNRHTMKLAAAAWWIVAGLLGAAASMLGMAAVVHAAAPFALPLLVAAALTSISIVEWGRPRKQWLLFAALIPLNMLVPVEFGVLFAWPIVAAISVTYALAHGSTAHAAELRAKWLAGRPYRYRVRSGWHRPVTSMRLRLGVTLLTFIVLWMLTAFVSFNLGYASFKPDANAHRPARLDTSNVTQPTQKLDMLLLHPAATDTANTLTSRASPAGASSVIDLPAAAALNRPDCHVPAPEYPASARRHGLSGRVVIRAVLSPQGLPESVSIVQSSQHDDLDEAARQAVLAMTCKPYLVNGRAMREKVSIPFIFSLRNDQG
ncbi:TonB family protein [Burkholderia sp. 22PA0099]|uniref:TonB family protein n=1 Tax=Burkholderia sp. 22PA0099 TaxID=3237372 RepID=UPI0039C04AD8